MYALTIHCHINCCINTYYSDLLYFIITIKHLFSFLFDKKNFSFTIKKMYIACT